MITTETTSPITAIANNVAKAAITPLLSSELQSQLASIKTIGNFIELTVWSRDPLIH